ncbi:phosphatidylinositol mannoside acyltransferase [Dermacoccaceae bacterium W4C1]
MSAVADRLTTAGFRLGWKAVRLLPEPAAYRLFDTVAAQMHRRNGTSVQRMRSNYARVRPELSEAELDDLVGAGLRSYLRYWCEAFRLPTYTRDQLDARMRLVNDGPARQALAQGRPLVLFLGHMGNWDWCGAWAESDFAHVTTVAERLKPEEVFQEFLDFREGLGMRIIPLTGGENPFPALVEAAQGGAFIPLLADRDLSRRGVEVTLCGHQAKAAAGPAALALETGAALCALPIHYEADPGGGPPTVVATFGTMVEPEPGLEHSEQIARMTQACIDDLGAGITAHTEDWHMMQRVFADDLDPRRS